MYVVWQAYFFFFLPFLFLPYVPWPYTADARRFSFCGRAGR